VRARGRSHEQGATGRPAHAARAQVLALIAEGRTDGGIAKELYVTYKTVEAHVRSIVRKLDLPRDSTENHCVHAVLTFLRARTP
jgi:DNA-binding NarL/FixJ family response regulator